MNFEQSILTLKEQLKCHLEIKNNKGIKAENFVLVGMGGSALAGGIIKSNNPKIPLAIHKSYGLPYIKEPQKTLVIFSSYSGNTEETLDALIEARKRGLKMAVISKNGKLLQIAKKENLPYIEIPNLNLQPRMALGFSTVSLIQILNLKKELKKLKETAEKIDFLLLKKEGKSLSEKLKNLVPIIYASDKNIEIGYNMKIKFNENAKAPAFCSQIPESNHNEISSLNKKTIKFAKNLVPLFLKDESDHLRIKKRMEITKKIYKEEGFETIEIEIKGDFFEKYFLAGVLTDYATFFLAQHYGFDPCSVPTIEKLKKEMEK